jgi:hypothetical protein
MRLRLVALVGLVLFTSPPVSPNGSSAHRRVPWNRVGVTLSAQPKQTNPDLRCLSQQVQQKVGCGCSLKVTARKCQASHDLGWEAHFLSELRQGAPLWLSLGGHEFSIPSRRPLTDSFLHGKGDSWEEEYEDDDMKVRVRYRPAKSTCPPEKEKVDDGCEFFDVAADVLLTVREQTHSYKALGACGC